MSLLQYEDYLPSHDENCESQANILKMGNFTYRSFYVSLSWVSITLIDWMNKTPIEFGFRFIWRIMIFRG